MSDTPVHGTVEAGFEEVRDVFERSFEKDGLGFAWSAYVDGRNVVNLWGGWADAARTHEWQRDTIVGVYSATKALTATCAHHLIDRGLLDVDAPIATYWPEFAQAGKADITVRMALSHQAGLPWATAEYPADKRLDWEATTDALARSTPVWEPGTRSEYHGGTFGYLVGEVIRRIDGRPIGTYFREEIGEPLGAECYIDFGPELDDRSAEVVGPADAVGGANTRKWRAAGDGAATGSGSADGFARLFAALACGGELDGVRVLRPETIEAAIQEQPLPKADAPAGDFGLGYQLFWKLFPAMNKQTFGHTGLGGSFGLANAKRRLSFAYVMNELFTGAVNDLLVATYGALGA